MSPELEFVLRSLAAFEGGGPPPPAVARKLVRGLESLLHCPGVSLDKALGLTPGRGQACIAEQYKRHQRDTWIVSHYQKHYATKNPNAASQDIANSQELLAENYHDPHIPDHDRRLFDRLESTDIPLPSQRTIYELLRNS